MRHVEEVSPRRYIRDVPQRTSHSRSESFMRCAPYRHMENVSDEAKKERRVKEIVS